MVNLFENAEEMMERLRKALDGRSMLLLAVGTDGPALCRSYEAVLTHYGIPYRRERDLTKGGYGPNNEYREIATPPDGIVAGDDVVALYDDISGSGKTLGGAYGWVKRKLRAGNVLATVDRDLSGVSDISRELLVAVRYGPDVWIYRNAPTLYQLLLDDGLIDDETTLRRREREILAKASGQNTVDLENGARLDSEILRVPKIRRTKVGGSK
jgi:hypothetical protein